MFVNEIFKSAKRGALILIKSLISNWSKGVAIKLKVIIFYKNVKYLDILKSKAIIIHMNKYIHISSYILLYIHIIICAFINLLTLLKVKLFPYKNWTYIQILEVFCSTIKLMGIYIYIELKFKYKINLINLSFNNLSKPEKLLNKEQLNKLNTFSVLIHI